VDAIDREIASQPAIWEAAAAQAGALDECLPRGCRLVVVGCGTSFYIAQAIAALREAARRGETDAFAASEVPDRPYDALLAISRSGTTTEVLSVLERVRRRMPTIAISATPDTPIPALAQNSLVLDFADEEAIVQTRFATAVLALVRAHLGDDVEAFTRAGREALEAELPDRLETFDRFVFLGSGWTVGLANEAALKLREASGAWAESYPAMEYRHGPISATTSATLVWPFGEVEPGVIESAARAGATVVDHRREPMAELVLVQRAAVRLARARAMDPSRPKHLSRSVVLTASG
jgi:CRISPR-associated protein Cas5a/b/c